MVEGKHLAVVIPAYNEETLLETTVAGIPSFVDRIYIVDESLGIEAAGVHASVSARQASDHLPIWARLALPAG